MSGHKLRLKAASTERLDLTGITPARLASLSHYEIARLTVGTGKDRLSLGDAFDLSGSADDTLVIEAGNAALDYVGAGLDGGTLRVVGDIGNYAGRQMRGGNLEIEGNARDFLASGATGGIIRVSGNAGNSLGAAMPGDRFGMLGGVALVGGNVGERAGEKMRRGTVVVKGKTGGGTGTRMIGGTIWAEGGIGPDPGLMMRRGTLIGPSVERLLPTFVDCGKHDLVIVRVLNRYLQAVLGAASPKPMPLFVRKIAGDMATIGRGEIFLPAA